MGPVPAVAGPPIINSMHNLIYNLAHDKINDPISQIFKVFLWILSLFYGIVIGFIKLCYKFKIFRSSRIDCPVISVGNITWGGTGKTPIVEYITKKLIAKGKRPAILSRGYKRKVTTSPLRLRSGQARHHVTSYEAMGDEPFMLKLNLPGVPILVGGDRLKTGRRAIEEHKADTIILDDGFGHRRLIRDLDIVVIDALNPFGNNQLIPRGILREPLSSLKRADVFLITKVDLAQESYIEQIRQRLDNINPKALIVESIHNPIGLSDQKGNVHSLDYLKGQSICIVSSLASPDSFKKLILNLGANVKLEFCFPDHYVYREADLRKIMASCKAANLKTIVTTQKDTVRLAILEETEKSIDLMVLRIEIKIINNEDKFLQRLFNL